MDIILIIPFLLLLLSIAILPFVNEKWWHKNYPYISFIPAVIVIIIYLMFLNGSDKILIALEDYISFICLLFSLYVVSGGIFFKIKGKATPVQNILILAAGSVLANIFGTTGAAMLLIKPFIESNKYRIKSYHIVFFIFLICNVGGSLTPIGDPPLLIGYIKGIPFFWITEHLFGFWFLAVAYLLIIFFLIDSYYFKRIKTSVKTEVEAKGEEISAGGFKNFIPLFIIVGSVFITKPFFLREAIMLVSAYISYKFTPKEIHKRNNFNFRKIGIKPDTE
jgi:Na+/H+ antiporter NhaD/arsenite permease-like protein